MIFFRGKNKSVEPDREFFQKIQPQGNVKFDERAIKKGNGYEACVHIFDYPDSGYTFWLEDFITTDNAVCTMDFSVYDIDEAKKHINRALKEDTYNYNNASVKTDSIDAGNSYNNLSELYNSISTAGEVLKLVHIRIYISGKTMTELEENAARLITDLESRGYRAGVYLNETEYEYRALFVPYSEQNKMINARMGHPIPAGSIAGGYPFNYVSKADPLGVYLGYVKNGGVVLFDPWHNDLISSNVNKVRNCYDAFIAGKKGSGKSTLLKKIMLNTSIFGNFIRGIAVSNEFDDIVSELDGIMIPMDGSGGRINILEIMRSGEDDNVNFTSHLSKLNMIYKYLSPDADSTECTEFENLCRELYIKFGIWGDRRNAKITGLPPQKYPIFNDLLSLVREELYSDFNHKTVHENLTEGRINRLEKIELVVTDIVNNYGNIFNGYTTFPDISSTQIVFFDIRNLTKLKSEIFNVQMFNILSMFWSTMLDVGLPEKEKWDSSNKTLEDFMSVVHTMLIIDEAHLLIKSGNVQILKYLQSFLRETRKYFAALWFATQSMRDVIPESASTEFLDELKILFELTQNKFIMQQDSSSIDLLRSIFGSALTESDYNSIPRFEQGECILADGVNSVRFDVDVNQEELSIFNGGA